MPKYEIKTSAVFTLEFDQKPSEDEIIVILRAVAPPELLFALEVNSINEVN